MWIFDVIFIMPKHQHSVSVTMNHDHRRRLAHLTPRQSILDRNHQVHRIPDQVTHFACYKKNNNINNSTPTRPNQSVALRDDDRRSHDSQTLPVRKQKRKI